jgi:hypothetical protein
MDGCRSIEYNDRHDDDDDDDNDNNDEMTSSVELLK